MASQTMVKKLHEKQESLSEVIEQGTPASFAEKIQTDGVVLELNGRAGPDPTRFGDWEKKGKCVDF